MPAPASLSVPRGLARLGFVACCFGWGAARAADPVAESFKQNIQPVLERYCYDCHGNGFEKGGVTLDEFAPGDLQDHKLWFRVLKNIRAGLMPPSSEEHALPAAEVDKISGWIERQAFGLDPAQPDPGRVTVRRLNRVEYRNTIRELTGVDFDTQKEFPSDDTGYGFDNIADVLTVSPMLTEKYLDAAQAIISKAVITTPRSVAEHVVPGRTFKTVKVDTKVPELPKPAAPAETPEIAAPKSAPATVAATGVPGKGQRRRSMNRGEPPAPTRPAPYTDDSTIVLSYYTPATVAAKTHVEHAGKYQLGLDLSAHETYAEELFDQNKCRLVFSMDGEKLLDREMLREGSSRKLEFTFDRELTAGDHEFSLEITPLTGPEVPQYRRLRVRLSSVTLRGPEAEKFWVKTPGYDRFFPRDVPAAAAARRAYAREILEKFATRAFRRPVDAAMLDKLTRLAEQVYAQPKSSFEAGVAQAMVAVLALPNFLFREDVTEPRRAGQTHPFVDEYSLASRLSYFFWSSMPDDELLRLAGQHRLRAELPAQVKRMLADRRGQEFVRNFTGQWLQARDIENVQITAEAVFLRDNPTPALDEARATLRRIGSIPYADRTPEQQAEQSKARNVLGEFSRQPKPDLTGSLRTAMRQETEMTFAYILREDRSLLELLDSNYTFLNETLAKHYGIPGVSGSEMRRVTLPPDSPRGGVLTQGTVLSVTSNPTRTSPVKRGVFILDAILGTPPAPPPPNIPALEDAAPAAKLRTLSLRETLALHATEPLCASCHMRMDPLGLALENFNAMGVWRATDAGQPIQPAGKLATGETFADVHELKKVLVTSRHLDFYRAFSAKLFTYALGRGVEYYDVLTLDRMVAALEASGGRPLSALQALLQSAPFQQRRARSAAATAQNTSLSSPSSEPVGTPLRGVRGRLAETPLLVLSPNSSP